MCVARPAVWRNGRRARDNLSNIKRDQLAVKKTTAVTGRGTRGVERGGGGSAMQIRSISLCCRLYFDVDCGDGSMGRR